MRFQICVFLGVILRSCGCRSEDADFKDWRGKLKTIRNGIHKIDTYLNAALDLLGGEDGLCRYKCSDDVGIPSMTKCCNQHDRCYDTCGNSKQDCDEIFQYCLSTICRNVQKTLGIDATVQACENAVEMLFNAVMHLGCKPYLDSQRASCMCAYEEKIDL
ncbi:group XIIA secretory phospholipase A2 isoform X2 [Mobula birostris]|uniref:group XIIA secretory phospholipase A2 isoform X2 n=1 Tax=Mobula birostris TaxID=1983395 RepID=UPI003B284B8F